MLFLAAVAVVAVALPGRAVAGAIPFDPTGGGGGNPGNVISVYAFDWSVGNSVAIGANPFTANSEFDVVYQARLANFLDQNGNPYNSTQTQGLNSNYEITLVARFRERVVSVNTNGSLVTANFKLAADQPNNFFEVFRNAPPAANDLAGTGFNTGTLLMSGAVVQGGTKGVGNFLNDLSNIQALDQFGTNNYPGINTVTGTGSFKFSSTIPFAGINQSYVPVGSSFINMDTNGDTHVPFDEVDPSALFVGGAGVGGSLFAPNIGTVNGAPLNSGGGPDFQFLSDLNGSGDVLPFTPIPEPSTFVLGGLALGTLGCFRRLVRRTNRAI
jgi:hypothetical protein